MNKMNRMNIIILKKDKVILNFEKIQIKKETNNRELIKLLKEKIPLYKTESKDQIYGNITFIAVHSKEISIVSEYKITDIATNMIETKEAHYYSGHTIKDKTIEEHAYKIINKANKIIERK